MRFDDSLETVLAADMSSPIGVQSAWRQLVDLIGRGRAPATAEAMSRLRAIRAQVPPPVRAASARALAFTNPPAALVRLFADDELSIAAPVLRIARLLPSDWIAMLPAMPSANRSILRHRRDLGPAVTRALESYGPSDFVLPPTELTAPIIAARSEAPVAEIADVSDDQPTGISTPEADESSADAMPEGGEACDVPAAEDLSSPEPIADAVPEAIDVPSPTVPSNDGADEARSPDESSPVVELIEPVSDADLEPEALGQPAEFAATLVTPSATIGHLLAPDPGNGQAMEPVSEEPPEDAANEEIASPAAPEPAAEMIIDWREVLAARPPLPADPTPPAPAPAIPSAPAVDGAALTALAGIALGVTPLVETARKIDEPSAASQAPEPATIEQDNLPVEAEAPTAETYQIADIVARIDAYQRHREEPDGRAVDEAEPEDADVPESFRFETDARGVFRWVAGVSRSALIGLALDGTQQALGAQVDGVATGAFRRRAGFANARLLVDGNSDAAGQWRISAIPVFDRATGRFTGYRGTGRRPRADERAELARDGRTPGTDAVRQLVHELRTPTTAIAGFAEMIEGELLGPVPAPYRRYAGTIRHEARGLLGAIEDLDTAARLDSNALDLRHETVEIAPLLTQIVADLRPLAALRDVHVTLFAEPGTRAHGDERAVERLAGRLLATMLAAGSAGETVMITAAAETRDLIAVTVDRPRALAAFDGDALLSADAELDEGSGAPLLGTGFALRLVRNLAIELGGSLSIGADRLTLRLPAAVTLGVGQASTN